MTQRVLVLGATGFLGANVTRALLAAGREVTAMRRQSSDLAALTGVADRVEFVTGDVRSPASLARAMRGMDAVVHCAAYYPVTSLDIAGSVRQAVNDTRNVIAAAVHENVGRFLFTSTLTTIGPAAAPRNVADERDAYVPGSVRSAYFESKWAMEEEVRKAAANGVDALSVCPAIVLGPWDVKPTSGGLVTAVAKGHLKFMVDGVLNVVHAGDVGAGHVAALERGVAGERYILGGENLTARAFFETVADEAGVAPPRVVVPANVVRGASLVTEAVAVAGDRAAGWVRPVAPKLARLIRRPPLLPLEAVDVVMHGQALSSEKAERDLGYTSRPAREAVRDALSWFKRTGRLP